jgi:hypothetical protein
VTFCLLNRNLAKYGGACLNPSYSRGRRKQENLKFKANGGKVSDTLSQKKKKQKQKTKTKPCYNNLT